MTKDLFPHIGEILLEKIINKDPTFLLDKLKLPKKSFVKVHRQISLLLLLFIVHAEKKKGR